MKELKHKSAGHGDTLCIDNIVYLLLYVTPIETKQEIYHWDVYKAPKHTDFIDIYKNI